MPTTPRARVLASVLLRLAVLAGCFPAAAALAQPGLVSHTPATQVFGEPSGVTMREPDVPREGEAVDLWIKVGPSFSYDRVYVYYTLDGSEPVGAGGNHIPPTTTPTRFLRSTDSGATRISFVRNQPNGFGGNDDWWKATIPLTGVERTFGTTIKYKVSAAWSTGGGGETFAGGGATSTYTVKLPWPGAGAGQPSPGAGYPPVSFWKEEAIFGNTYCAGMLDQNGTVYDFHFPTPGGVYGVGTRNEGYVDGLDTFPPNLPQAWRGQMHLNQAMAGVRVDGVTHWLSNPSGVSYDQVQQAYVTDSNTVRTTQRLYAGGANISVEQLDFSPMNAAWPVDGGGNPQRHLYIKRLRLTNSGPAAKTADVYWYVDPALNGGDGYDAMFVDPVRGAMVAFDNTGRTVTGTGVGFSSPNEYNPTTDSGYQKNKSLYLASAMKLAGTGGGIESAATDFWRDTSADNGQGWMGLRVTLQPGATREVDVLMAGAVDDFAGATGTYSFKLQNAVQWFYTTNMDAVQAATDSYWSGWVNSGTWVDTPDDRYDGLMKRGLLATALHCDAVNGGVIAGFHNGAYPYVWPRDAVYAAVTLARTGHLAEAENVYRWMKEVTFRSPEPWGRKGFWKQKYSTDGYVIWGAPQIDETAVLPWGVNFQYRMTADPAVLNRYVEQVRDAVESCTRTSGVDGSRLNLTAAYPGAPAGFPGLMYSNNVWEDSYAPFVYSNANIVRGLRDAASIFDALNLPAERDNAAGKAAEFTTGLLGRLDWDGENTDVSMLGVVYPFNVIPATDARATRLIERIKGTRTKFNGTAGSAEPLVNASGEHAGTVNRYWGDNYWNGGPWFLTTLWYGLFHAERADLTPGKADIDDHKLRIDLMIDRLGPAGMGAEQIAYATGPGASLLYPGQADFKLQTAWPNAWESMSTFVDSVMAFLDYQPDAAANTVRIAPKLPSAWGSMTFRNVTLVNTPAGWTHRLDVAVTEAPGSGNQTVTLTNTTGNPVTAQVTLKLPPGRSACSVTVGATPVTYVPSVSGGLQVAAFPVATGPGATTTLTVRTIAGSSPDYNRSGSVELLDIFSFLADWFAGNPAADFNGAAGVDLLDIFAFLGSWFAGCP